jgi:hypothetical protein
MSKFSLILFVFLNGITAFGQTTSPKILYVIDSIPLINDPEPWNPVLREDIADYSLITNQGSLHLMGWEQVDGVAYLFTKAYRNRPDSVRSIPSLRQMVPENGVWTLKGRPYSGSYIDYYNDGKLQNKGVLLNGNIDGELRVYYKTGIIKSVTHYKEGIRHGLWMDYYQNGAFMRVDEFVDGKANRNGKLYFINGQLGQELRPKKETGYDTSITYYSNGKIRSMALTKTGVFKQDKKEERLSYYTTMFYQYLHTGDIKAANKSLYEIWLIDSTSIDTYFKEGLLLSHEFRFDDAITQFDNALTIEPLMREALEQRGLARIKKYKIDNTKKIPHERKDVPLVVEDVMRMPEEEKAKVCTDILLADAIDPGVNYNNKAVPETILNYCKKRSNH